MKRLTVLSLLLFLWPTAAAQAAPEISSLSMVSDRNSPVLIYGSGFAGADSQAVFYDAAWEGKAEDKEEPARREASLGRYLAGKPDLKAPAAPRWAKVMAGDAGTVAAVTIFDGPHLVQVRAGKEDSRPFIVNRPEIWGVSPRSPRPGDSVTVWGPNLGEEFYLVDGSGKALFLQGYHAYNDHSGRPDGRFVKLIKLPEEAAPGEYRLYAHWGRSDAGWSRARAMNILEPAPAARPLLRVREMGAQGDGQTDDTDAVMAALKKAEEVKGIVFFDAGRYIISRSLIVPSGVDMVGVSRDASIIEASPVKPFDVSATPVRQRSPAMVVIRQGSRLERLGFDMTDVRGLPSEKTADIILVWSGGSGPGPVIRFCRLQAENNARHAGWPDNCAVNGFSDWGADIRDTVFESNEVTVTGAAFRDDAVSEGYRIRFNVFRQHSPHSSGGAFVLKAHRESLVEGNIWENTGRGVVQQSRFGQSLRHNLYMHNILRNLRKSDGEIIYYEGGDVVWSGRPESTDGRRLILEGRPDLAAIEKTDISQRTKENLFPHHFMLISEGRGLGQIREITGTVDGAIILDRAWDAPPDKTSLLLLLGGAYIENLHVGNEYIDCHQWTGVYGTGVRNAWVNDTYDRVGGGLDLWKIGGYRQVSFNLAYANKMHQRAGIVMVNNADDTLKDGSNARLQLFGNEVRNNSVEDRTYASTENGQNAPRLRRQVINGKSNPLSPLPGMEPAIGIFNMLGHPEMGPAESDPAYAALPPAVRWNLIYGNQISRCSVGIDVGKSVENTLIIGNLILQTELPINDLGRGTVKENNIVHRAALPIEGHQDARP